MTLQIRIIELIPRPLEAVQFIGNDQDRSDIRQWVQDRTADGTVVLTSDALYIQGFEGTEKVEDGEWVLFDVADKVFRSAKDGAIRAFYRDAQFTEDR